MSADGLTFEEEGHVYRYNGVVVPGVTQLLQPLHSFAGVPLDVLQVAQERGTDVHDMTQLVDEDDLDEAKLQAECPTIHAYLPSYQKFLRDCTPNWRHIEEPVFHKTLRYACRPDRIGEFKYQGRRVPDAVVEYKTSEAAHPVWDLQTMAQAHAAGRPSARRFSLQLRIDGAYRLKEWTDPDSWPAFVSLLTLHTWKMRNRL